MESGSLTAVIVATVGLLASALTASLSYYFTKKHQLKMEERRLKEEFYKSFIKALSDVAIDNEDEEAKTKLSEAFNSLLLIAGANVVKPLMDFHDLINSENTVIPRDSAEWIIKHNELLTELIKSMRCDLFGKEKNLDKLPAIHLVGNRPKKQAPLINQR